MPCSDAHDAPDIVGGQDDEDQADEQDHGPAPFKLPAVLVVFEVREAHLDEKGNSQHHGQSGEDHIVDHRLDLCGGVLPGLDRKSVV